MSSERAVDGATLMLNISDREFAQFQRFIYDAAGITLSTIQVNTDGDPTSTLLQKCASDPTKFFLLKSSNEIISTFDDISFKLTRLHLAK